MNSVILINKPIDYRSAKCVAIARHKLHKIKVGHAGTLDSTASGLLVLLTGNATRLCEHVMSLPKVYRAVIQFGAETDTYDYSGGVVSEKGFDGFDGSILSDELFRFSGLRLQKPPAVSAIKIDGQPAYKLARSGQEIDMKERPVFFRQVKILTPYNPKDGTVTLEIRCGRGTYIRSLAHDLGKIAGCGAYVKSLVRTSTGIFSVDRANSPDDEKFTPLSLSELAENFTRIYVTGRDEKSFTNGLSILLSHSQKTERGFTPPFGHVCVEGDKFVGFGSYAGYEYIKPEVIVPKEPC